MFTEQEVRQIESIVEPLVKALGGKPAKTNSKEDEAMVKEHAELRRELVKGVNRIADALETILGEGGLKINMTTTTINHDDIIDAEIEEEHKQTKTK